MQIDLGALEAGETVRGAFDEGVALQSEERTTRVHARGDIRVDRTPGGARLRGHIETEVPLVCSRCLRDLREAVRTDLDEEVSVRPLPAATQRELGRQELIASIGPQMTLDVSDIVRQHLEIALPMAPLCRPDCRGLCPVCGVNWNDETCAHAVA